MGEDILFPIWERGKMRLKDFDAFKLHELGQIMEVGEDFIDEGVRGAVRALNSHSDVCTGESCMGKFAFRFGREDVFESYLSNKARHWSFGWGSMFSPASSLENPEMFPHCCPECSQGSICELRKQSVIKVKSGIESTITVPMQPGLRFDWIPEYREEWSHGLKKFGSPLTTMYIEDVLGGLDVPDGFMILLEISLPQIMAVNCRNPETEEKLLKAVHSAGWVYSWFRSWSDICAAGDPSNSALLKATKDLQPRMLWIMNSPEHPIYIPLSNPKESLPPPERLELIVREANAAMERWQAKLPALARVASSL